MLKNLEYEGLCSTCMDAPHCIFRKDAKTPILQCEEFKKFPPAERKTVDVNSSKQLRRVSATVQNARTSKHKGLCVNCAKAETCIFTKPEGGVWRCEEYE